MILYEDFFDDETIDIEIQSPSDYELLTVDNDYCGLVGLYLTDIDIRIVCSKQFIKKLNMYEKMFRAACDGMGLDVKFDKIVTVTNEEAKSLEKNYGGDNEIIKNNYKIYAQPYGTFVRSVVVCAKIYYDKEITTRKVVQMVDAFCPIVRIVVDKYYDDNDLEEFIITFDKELLSSVDEAELMFKPHRYHIKAVSPVYKNNNRQYYYNSRNIDYPEKISDFYKICKTFKKDMTLDSLVKVLFRKTNGNAYTIFENLYKDDEIIKAIHIDADEILDYNVLTRSGTRIYNINYPGYQYRNTNMSFEDLTKITEYLEKQHPGLYILKCGNANDWTWKIFFDGAITIGNSVNNNCEVFVSTKQNDITYFRDLSIKDYNDFVRFSENSEDEDDFVTMSLMNVFTTILGVNKKAFNLYNEFVKL